MFFAQASTCWLNYSQNGYLDRNPEFWPWYDPVKAVMEANPRLRVAAKNDSPSFRLPAVEHLYSLVTRNQIPSSGEAPPGTNAGDLCLADEFLAPSGVDIADAIEMLTINSAHALGVSDVVGSLRRGKFADLVVLSGNPLDTPPENLSDIEVLMTMVGGEVQHCAEGQEALCPAG